MGEQFSFLPMPFYNVWTFYQIYVYLLVIKKTKNKRIFIYMVQNENNINMYKKKSRFYFLETATVINYLDIFIEIFH